MGNVDLFSVIYFCREDLHHKIENANVSWNWSHSQQEGITQLAYPPDLVIYFRLLWAFWYKDMLNGRWCLAVWYRIWHTRNKFLFLTSSKKKTTAWKYQQLRLCGIKLPFPEQCALISYWNCLLLKFQHKNCTTGFDNIAAKLLRCKQSTEEGQVRRTKNGFPFPRLNQNVALME